MLLLPEWVHRPNEKLARYDIGGLSLASAHGLPGVQIKDPDRYINELNTFAKQVESETQLATPLFESRPWDFDNSRGKFRMEALVTVLQRDFGFAYDPSLIERDDFFRDPGNIFVHGLIERKKGTCSNLPILIVAVGRRLGYPLKLATTKWHLFARWEGEGERFNIECTSKGFVTHSDDYYMTWPKSSTREEAKKYCFLKSKTPREELAYLLNTRGACEKDHGNVDKSAIAFAWAAELEPDNHLYSGTLTTTMDAWKARLMEIWPKGFPNMRIHFPQRVFKNIPQDLERHLFHLKTMDSFLHNENMQRLWWGPLRRNETPPDLPKRIVVTYSNAQDFRATFER